MSESRPPPPPSFPTPKPNVTRGSTYPLPPGPVYPPQTSHYGNYPPQQPTTYPTPQPPPAHQTGGPHPANANAHAPPSTYTYSSSPPHLSAHLPSYGSPQASPPFPMPSVQGGYGASNNSSGPPPPPPMPQRIATMPTPGQAHNPHSVPYHNVPAPVINHRPSHSGMSGVTRSVTADWSHHVQSYSHNEDFGQSPEATSHMSGNYSRERAPPSSPAVGQLRCQHCRSAISRTAYERFGMFCKEKHKNEWYAKQSQNRR